MVEDDFYTYLGCYEDNPDFDLKYGPRGEYTVETCREECKEYPLFGIKPDGTCACDYTFKHPNMLRDEQCEFVN